MRRLLILVSMLAGVLPAAPAQASGPATFEEFSVAGALLNRCSEPEETVTVVRGSFQIVRHETTDSSGGFHKVTAGNAKGVEGVGDSTGTRYRVIGDFSTESGGLGTETDSSNGSNAQRTVTVVDDMTLISQGSGDNFTVKVVFHLTINSLDEVTSLHLTQAGGECRG